MARVEDMAEDAGRGGERARRGEGLGLCPTRSLMIGVLR